MDVVDPGGLSDASEHACDHVPVEAAAVEHDEAVEVIGAASQLELDQSTT